MGDIPFNKPNGDYPVNGMGYPIFRTSPYIIDIFNGIYLDISDGIQWNTMEYTVNIKIQWDPHGCL